MKTDKPRLFDGKTIEQWDVEWVNIPSGLKIYLRHLRWKVGLFYVSLDGRCCHVGHGVDKTGGLASRLSAFGRTSPSGRNHHAGRLIHEHLDEVDLKVLITGHGPAARKIAEQLRAPMIEKHDPIWTVPAHRRPAFKWPSRRKPKWTSPGTMMSPYTGTVPSLSPPSEVRGDAA